MRCRSLLSPMQAINFRSRIFVTASNAVAARSRAQSFLFARGGGAGAGVSSSECYIRRKEGGLLGAIKRRTGPVVVLGAEG